MHKTPLQMVRDRYGSKEKLVDELMGLIKRPSDLPKDKFKKKLLAQSNKKLMVLHDREQLVKDKFGNRDKLIDAIVEIRGGKKSEDKALRKRLTTRTTGQLIGLARRLELVG